MVILSSVFGVIILLGMVGVLRMPVPSGTERLGRTCRRARREAEKAKPVFASLGRARSEPSELGRYKAERFVSGVGVTGITRCV